jgi:hypothetical protein
MEYHKSRKSIKINEELGKNTWWKGKTCKAVLEINQHSIPV